MDAKSPWLENADLFTLHFSELVADFAHSSGKVLKVQGEISGEEQPCCTVRVRRDLEQTQFYFLQHPLIGKWWEWDCFSL